MSINLKKGQKIDLRKSNPGLSAVRVGLGWDPVDQGGGGFLKSLFGSGKADIDCDASVFLLNGEGWKNGTPFTFAFIVGILSMIIVNEKMKNNKKVKAFSKKINKV